MPSADHQRFRRRVARRFLHPRVASSSKFRAFSAPVCDRHPTLSQVPPIGYIGDDLGPAEAALQFPQIVLGVAETIRDLVELAIDLIEILEMITRGFRKAGGQPPDAFFGVLFAIIELLAQRLQRPDFGPQLFQFRHLSIEMLDRSDWSPLISEPY